MDEVANERLAEILPLQQALAASWTFLKVYLEQRKRELVTDLVAADDEQKRGRIKEINDLLELPERLQQEAVNLQQKPQEPAEYP
jgi:hypothetical protein